MKIFMAGVGGMLGHAIHQEFQEEDILCTDKDVNEVWLSYLDFTDANEYVHQVTKFGRPDYIFHIGALTDLEYCEKHPDYAYLNNVIGVENAVNIAKILQIPIVYISTAGIFDGEKDMYDDWDIPSPINVYGRTKYLGERYIVENTDRYFVLRAGWMMGGYDKDKKFVKKILDQIKEGAKTINAVSDKLGSPTYTVDFAKGIREVIRSDYYGVYNMSGVGFASRADVASKIVELMGLDIDVRSVKSDAFPEYSTPRPPSEILINKKLQLRGIDIMRPWGEALEHYLTNNDNK